MGIKCFGHGTTAFHQSRQRADTILSGVNDSSRQLFLRTAEPANVEKIVKRRGGSPDGRNAPEPARRSALPQRTMRTEKPLFVQRSGAIALRHGLPDFEPQRVVKGRHRPPIAAEIYDLFMNLMSRISNINSVRASFLRHNAGFMASLSHKLLPACARPSQH